MVFPNAGAGAAASRANSTKRQWRARSCWPCWRYAACRSPAIRGRFGTLTGIFLVGYAIARIVGEFFRQPDAFLGFLFAGATMGQLLSLPMIVAGAWLIARAQPAPQPA